MWTRVATRKQSCNCAQVAPCSFPVGSSLAKLTAWAVCHFSDFLQILALLPPFCITPLQMPFDNSSKPYAQFPAKIASSHANIQLISAKSDQIRLTKTSLSNLLTLGSYLSQVCGWTFHSIASLSHSPLLSKHTH